MQRNNSLEEKVRPSLRALLIAGLCGTLGGCNFFGSGANQLGAGSLPLLPEGRGIKRLPDLTSDARTEQIFWSLPFYRGHVGGHAVIGKVGELPHRLDDQYQGLTGASWSHDGQRIAMVVKTGTRVPEAPNSSMSGNELNAVYVGQPTGSSYEKVASDLNNASCYLAPDGKKLLVRTFQSLASSTFTLMDVEAKTEHTIPLGNAYQAMTSEPLWSPNGARIALLIQRKRLVIHELASQHETTIDTTGDSLVGWSPDGERIYVGQTDYAETLALMGYSPDGSQVASASITVPSTPRGTPFNPLLSPDGTRVAFALQGLTSQGVCLADVSGGTARLVVPPSIFIGWLDASTLLCESRKDGNLQVDYTVDLTQR